MGIMLLTSTGLSAKNVSKEFASLTDGLLEKSVAIVTTASEGKEQNKYAQLAYQQLVDLGFKHPVFVDLEFQPDFDFMPFNVIYVCGGNTFYLLKYARASNFGQAITDLLSRDGIYVGVSAGSIIVTPDISVAAEINPDSNDVELRDLPGFGLVPFALAVHYEESEKDDVQLYVEQHNLSVRTLTDAEALLIEGEQERKISQKQN